MDKVLVVIGLLVTILIIGLYTTNTTEYASISLSNSILNFMLNSDPISVYLVLFLGVIISNASILVFIPYPLLVIYAIEAIKNLLLVIIIASFGAAIGEMSSYFIGKFGRKITKKHIQFYEKLSRLLNKNRKKVYLAIFIFALTPLPDDLILVPLGLAEFGFLRSFLPCLAGKLILITILAVLSHALIRLGAHQNVILDILTIWFILGMFIFAKHYNEEKLERVAGAIIE